MKLSKKEIKEILNNWNLGKLESIEKIESGVVNHNWLVKSSEGQFILRRIRKDKKIDELEFELFYLNCLKENDFPYETPAPILTKDNKQYVEANGHFWAYRFIEGKYIKEFTENELKEEAKMMAAYHTLLEKANLDNKAIVLNDMGKSLVLEELNDFREKINSGKIKTEYNTSFLKEADKLILILEKLDMKEYVKLKKYPIHRDLNPENLVWKDKKLVGIIDFDNVSQLNDAFIKDIAIVLQHSCVDNHVLNIKKAKFFINEYQKHKTIDKVGIKLISTLLIAAFIEDFSYNFWLIVNDPARANIPQIKSYSQAAQWHFNNKDKITKELLS